MEFMISNINQAVSVIKQFASRISHHNAKQQNPQNITEHNNEAINILG